MSSDNVNGNTHENDGKLTFPSLFQQMDAKSENQFLLTSASFRRCVRELQIEIDPEFGKTKWSLSALMYFQAMIEHVMLVRSAMMVLMASHGKRVTVTQKDFDIIRRVKKNLRSDAFMKTER